MWPHNSFPEHFAISITRAPVIYFVCEISLLYHHLILYSVQAYAISIFPL